MKNKRIITAVLAALNALCLLLTGYSAYRLSEMTPQIEIYGSQAQIADALEGYDPVIEGEGVLIQKENMSRLFVREICDVLNGADISDYSINDLSQSHRLAGYFAGLYGFILVCLVFFVVIIYLIRDIRQTAELVKRQLRDRYFTEIIKDRLFYLRAFKWLAGAAILSLLAAYMINFSFIQAASRIDLPTEGQAGEFLKAVERAVLMCKAGAVISAAEGAAMLTAKGGKDRCRE